MTDQFSHLPRWKCHKIARAAQVVAIEINKCGNFDLTLSGVDKPVTVDKLVFLRGEGGRFVGGYLVVYDDGYVSWSPREAFEAGYTKISDTSMLSTEAVQAILNADTGPEVKVMPDGSCVLLGEDEAKIVMAHLETLQNFLRVRHG